MSLGTIWNGIRKLAMSIWSSLAGGGDARTRSSARDASPAICGDGNTVHHSGNLYIAGGSKVTIYYMTDPTRNNSTSGSLSNVLAKEPRNE